MKKPYHGKFKIFLAFRPLSDIINYKRQSKIANKIQFPPQGIN